MNEDNKVEVVQSVDNSSNIEILKIMVEHNKEVRQLVKEQVAEELETRSEIVQTVRRQEQERLDDLAAAKEQGRFEAEQEALKREEADIPLPVEKSGNFIWGWLVAVGVAIAWIIQYNGGF